MKSMKYMKILDVFVVMPNHVHGIIIINKTNGSADTTSATGNTHVETQNTDVETQYTDVETQYTDVETQNFASLLRIIRKEHYLLNQSRNIHWISQSKNGISYTIRIYLFLLRFDDYSRGVVVLEVFFCKQ